MHHQSGQRGHAHQDRVPVQNSGVLAEPEIRPQWLKEISGFVQRHSTNHIPQGCAKKYHQQQAGSREDKVPERDPYPAIQMIAEFDSAAAKNQKPEHHHERKIKAAESAGIEHRKCKIKRASRGQQPYLISIPYWADRSDHLTALRVRIRYQKVKCARAYIESVEQHVHCDHYRNQTEPYRAHRFLLSLPLRVTRPGSSPAFPVPARVRFPGTPGTAIEWQGPCTCP